MKKKNRLVHQYLMVRNKCYICFVYTGYGISYVRDYLVVEFSRVVLDEAHNIKSRSTKTAKACYALRSVRRWALTGKI